jgi:hypothetical protein
MILIALIYVRLCSPVAVRRYCAGAGWGRQGNLDTGRRRRQKQGRAGVRRAIPFVTAP